jgi:acyl-CoA thioesterase
LHNGKSTGLYHVTISNQKNHVVAIFKGTCFRTNKKLVEL